MLDEHRVQETQSSDDSLKATRQRYMSEELTQEVLMSNITVRASRPLIVTVHAFHVD